MFAPHEMSTRVRDFFAHRIHRWWDWVVAVGAIGPDDPKGERYRRMGKDSMIAFPPGSVFGERWIEIGDRTLVGPHVSLSVGMWGEDIDHDAPVVLHIGDRCNIGRGSSIIARERVVIEDDVTTGPGVYITDHNHSYADPHTPITQQFPVAAPVRIGRGTWLGNGAIVLPGTDIGENVTVAGGSVVRGHVPDRCVVAGVPAKVVRRWTPDEGWQPPMPPQAPPPEWWVRDSEVTGSGPARSEP